MFREGRHVEKSTRRCETTHRFFHWFSIDFSRKIERKSFKNRQHQLCAQKSTKTHVWNVVFLAKNRFLANFWAPPGSPGPSREDPENSQNRSFFSFMVNCARKRARAASGRPREGPGGPPRRPQGTILRRFSDRFCTSKTNEKTNKNIQKILKIIQKILKSSWLWLGRPWTLDR